MRSHPTEDSQLGQPKENGVSIETVWATSFGDLLASEEVARAFALQIEDCMGLLGGTVERTHDNREYRRMLDERVGDAAVVVTIQEPNSGILE